MSVRHWLAQNEKLRGAAAAVQLVGDFRSLPRRREA
jgi:hypothetical protein